MTNIPLSRRITPRESDVLTLLAKGYTSKKIGLILNISSKTVDAHRLSLRRKLKVSTTTGLIQYAIKLNLIQ